MKKIIALMLTLVMLALALASCGGDGETPTEAGTKKETETEEETTPEEVDENYICELPSGLNYNKREIKLLTSDQDLRVDEFLTEEVNYGITPAVYSRNSDVEETLNIILTIEALQYSDENVVYKRVETATLSGLAEDLPQVVVGAPYRFTSYTQKDEYLNLNSLGNLNLKKHYWAQNFNNVFSLGAKTQYLATGSLSVSLFRCMFVTLYNRDMFSSFGQTDLYDLVKSNEWTIDKQTEIAKIFTTVGEVDPSAKVYGLSSGMKISIDPYWVGFDINLIGKDATTNLYVNNAADPGTKSRLTDAVDKIHTLFNSEDVTLIPYEDDGTSCPTVLPFSEKRAAMCTTMCYGIEKNINEIGEIDYAVVPMPKFNAEQSGFFTCIQDQVSCVGVPTGHPAADYDMIGAVLESLAATSQTYIVPEYYDKRLCLRYSTDEKVSEMMKLIYETSNISIGAAFSGTAASYLDTGYTTLLRQLISAKANTVSSTLRSYRGAFDKWVEFLNTMEK